MSDDIFEEFDCDLCGSAEAAEIPAARRYTGGQPLHVCKSCGFVYVRRRRPAGRIAEVWSDDIYEKGYTARIPAVKARQVYVAESIDTAIGLNNKTLCDIGGGEGQFLNIVKQAEYGASVFAIEPSERNCRMMEEMGIETFCGSIEDYTASHRAASRRFDIVTVMWTLENCQSCRTMMDAAHGALKDGGHVVLATGSRILVPFKKPLHYYLGSRPLDTHCFRFSANTLKGLLAVGGFAETYVNRYIDTDFLIAIGTKTDRSREIEWRGDDYREVIDFFARWDRDTQQHYSQT